MNMIKTFTAGLLTDWNLMRWLRLVLGLFISVQAVQNHDTLAGTIAALLLLQVVTNTGCCGTQGCAAPMNKNKSADLEKVEYQEIDSEKN